MEKIKIKILICLCFFPLVLNAQQSDYKLHFGGSISFLRMGLWGRFPLNTFNPSLYLEKKQHKVFISPIIMPQLKVDFSYFDYPLFVIVKTPDKWKMNGLNLGYNFTFGNQDSNKLKFGLDFELIVLKGKESGIFTGEITPFNFGTDNYTWNYTTMTGMLGLYFKWQPFEKISFIQHIGFSYTDVKSDFISDYHGKTNYNSNQGNVWVYGRLGIEIKIK